MWEINACEILMNELKVKRRALKCVNNVLRKVRLIWMVNYGIICLTMIRKLLKSKNMLPSGQ